MQVFALPEPVEADCHPFMAQTRLRPVGAEQAVPPGQVETEIAVRLGGNVGMMHPVHVRRDDNPSQHAVQPCRHPQIAVIEH